MASQEVPAAQVKPFVIVMAVICLGTIAIVLLSTAGPPVKATNTAPAPNASSPAAASVPVSKPAAEPASKPAETTATPATAATATANQPAAAPAAVADTKPTEYRPAGTGQPTLVVVESGGGSAAAVQRVEFFVEAPFKTPSRGTGKISPGAIAVKFEQASYDAKIGKFAVNLQGPQVALVSQQAAPLAVSIVWPKFAGWTYRGKLKVIPAGQQPIEVQNVEVDIVKAPVK